MAGLEIVALIPAIVTAFTGAADLFMKWRDRRRERKNTEENTIALRALLRGQELQQAYDRYFVQLGASFARGDRTGREALLEQLIIAQSVLIDFLQKNQRSNRIKFPHVGRITLLANSARVNSITALAEQFQRLAQVRAIESIPGAPPLTPQLVQSSTPTRILRGILRNANQVESSYESQRSPPLPTNRTPAGGSSPYGNNVNVASNLSNLSNVTIAINSEPCTGSQRNRTSRRPENYGRGHRSPSPSSRSRRIDNYDDEGDWADESYFDSEVESEPIFSAQGRSSYRRQDTNRSREFHPPARSFSDTHELRGAPSPVRHRYEYPVDDDFELPPGRRLRRRVSNISIEVEYPESGPPRLIHETVTRREFDTENIRDGGRYRSRDSDYYGSRRRSPRRVAWV